MINFEIDELVACLKKVSTGDIVETEIIRLRRKSFLSKFNKRTGWHVNWSKFPSDVEIYAVVLKGSVDIQGLIALQPDQGNNAIYIKWACVSPNNNIWENGSKEYSGVGGHLFAIAAKRSFDYGFEGFMYGEASCKAVLDHYVKTFNASRFPFGEVPYRFVVEDEVAKTLMEVYTYDWTKEEY